MHIDEIIKHIEDDFQEIDRLDLMHEFVKLSKLFSKYIKMKSDEGIRLAATINEQKVILSEKYEYYSGKAPADVYKAKPFNLNLKTKDLIQRYVDADQEVINQESRVAIQREKVEILNAALQEIKNRQWTIKGAQDQLKFENGH